MLAVSSSKLVIYETSGRKEIIDLNKVRNSMRAHMTAITIPQSEHFTFNELAEGVWAAIVKPTGLAASNSGIVDLGDRTVVFDSTLSLASAVDLGNVAEHLTGRQVACVLTSHGDRDHVFGNAAFSPKTEIYATTRTRELMIEHTSADIVEFKKKWPELQKQ